MDTLTDLETSQALIIDELCVMTQGMRRDIRRSRELLDDAAAALAAGDLGVVAEFIDRAGRHARNAEVRA